MQPPGPSRHCSAPAEMLPSFTGNLLKSGCAVLCCAVLSIVVVGVVFHGIAPYQCHVFPSPHRLSYNSDCKSPPQIPRVERTDPRPLVSSTKHFLSIRSLAMRLTITLSSSSLVRGSHPSSPSRSPHPTPLAPRSLSRAEPDAMPLLQTPESLT